MLHACIIDKDVNPPEMLQCLLNNLLAISWLGEIGEDEESLNLRVFLSEVSHSAFDLFIGSKSVQDDVKSPGGEGVGDSESNSAERSSDEGDFIALT